jgi:glycosyltransferase involved in cell wall biosynthesis
VTTKVAEPPVSVVIATKDRPELLARAIRGVMDQSYGGEIECVVVFDSPQAGPLPAPERPGRTIRGLVNGRTPGLAGARNTGIDAATGDLIAFCDDDDTWLADKLAVQLAALRMSPECPVASCGIVVIRGKGSTVRRPKRASATFADLLRSRHMEIHPSTLLIRRTALPAIGLVDEHIPGGYGEDYEWLLRVTRVGPVATPSQPLVHVHWDSTSYFFHRWRVVSDALQYLLGRVPEFAGDRRGAARIYGQIAIAEAGCSEMRRSRRWAMKALRQDPVQPRAYLALAASVRLIDVNRVLRLANSIGRGV